MSDVKPIPAGVPVIMPMLVCRDPARELEFCRAAFGAVERVRRLGPDGSVAHAAIAIDGALVMIEAEFPTVASRAPNIDASSPVVLYLYVGDVDQVARRAVAAGAKILAPVTNQFWGDRTGRIIDPSGHVWIISTRVEETSEDQRSERWSDIREAKG